MTDQPAADSTDEPAAGSTEDPSPGGQCWCGCNSEPKGGAFFLPGHDRAAEAAVVRLIYGSIPKFLTAHGFGPQERSAIKELAELRRAETG